MTAAQTSLTLRTAREKFITALEADGLSPNTIREYRRVTGQLLAFFGDISPAELSPDDLRCFLADYRRSRSPKTVYNAWVVLRSFWRYLEEHGYPNIARALRAPRYPRPATRLLTPQDIRSLLKACEYTAPSRGKRKPFRMPRPTARRDKALVLLLADTGMRAGEVAALRVKDVDLSSGRIIVRSGKGGKGRTVFASATTLEALQHYWEEREARPDEPAFTTRTGRALSANEINHLIVNLGKRAGIKVHPHALRHFFATQFLRNGGDPLTLKRLLGHSTLRMVEYYVQLVDDDLRDAHFRASPIRGILAEDISGEGGP